MDSRGERGRAGKAGPRAGSDLNQGGPGWLAADGERRRLRKAHRIARQRVTEGCGEAEDPGTEALQQGREPRRNRPVAPSHSRVGTIRLGDMEACGHAAAVRLRPEQQAEAERESQERQVATHGVQPIPLEWSQQCAVSSWCCVPVLPRGARLQGSDVLRDILACTKVSHVESFKRSEGYDAMGQDQPLDTVEVRITIAARLETVFAYFREPAAFERWMGTGSSIAPRKGGQVRVTYPNGDIAAGVIEELVPNQRLVMSWGYERGPAELPLQSTRVEVTLTPIDGGTRVVLRHTGLGTAAQRRNHRAGWRYYLASLSQLASSALDQVIDRALDSYAEAWGTPDPAHRRRLLEQCWDLNGVFRDSMGYVEGIEDLVEYIGMAQQFSPGIRLAREGAVIRSQGFVSHGWRMTQLDGATILTGSNTVEFTGEGLIRSVTGFWNPPARSG